MIEIEDCLYHKADIKIHIVTKNDNTEYNQDVIDKSVKKLVDVLYSNASHGFCETLEKALRRMGEDDWEMGKDD